MGKHVAGGGRRVASARQHHPDQADFLFGRGYKVAARSALGMRSSEQKGTFTRRMTGSNGAEVQLFALPAARGTHKFRVVAKNGQFPTLDEIVRNDEGLGGRQVSFPNINEKIVEVFID